MYTYSEFDTAFLAERNRQFRAQVARRISGNLTEDEFKPLRLMNGLYLQLHAHVASGHSLWLAQQCPM